MSDKIFHIVSSKRYTGGAQVAYLWHKALLNEGIESYFVYQGGYKLEEKIKNEKNVIPYYGLLDKIKKIKSIPKNSIILAHLSEDHWLTFLFGIGRKKILVFHNKNSIKKDLFHKLIYYGFNKVIFGYHFKEKKYLKKYRVFPPIYDLNVYYPGSQPSNILNICTIGKLEKERKHYKFIFLCNELKKLNFEFKGYVIGQGKYLNTLIDLRDELNLKKEIGFLGYFEDEKLASFLRKMDMLVWISPGSQMGHRAIAEGILCGALPISYEMEGVDFWIKDGKSGLILSENLKESAKRIIEIFNDKERYLKLRDCSFKKTIKKVEQKKFVKNFLEFIYYEDSSNST